MFSLLATARPQAESFGDQITALGLNATFSVLGVICWMILFALGVLCQRRYASVVFSWVRPVTMAFEVFCVIAALRFAMAFVVLFYPAFDMQNYMMALYVVALCVSVGYASVYYRRIPYFILRAKGHQANSRRFKNIADNATDAFIEIDPLSNIWYANKAAARIFGYFNEKGDPDPRQMLGMEITDFMPPEFRERHSLGLQRYMETGESTIIGRHRPTELMAVRQNGEQFPIELTLSSYELNDAVRFIAIVRDISYRRELERKVHEAER